MDSGYSELRNASSKIQNSLRSLAFLHHKETAVLNYGNVIVNKSYQNSTKVRLLSVGVDKEGLAQALFVGKGGLTAVIIGEESTPCSRLLLRTIQELDCGVQKHGVYVIAHSENDLFNFQLAVERANQDCSLRSKLLLIGDAPSWKNENVSSGYILLVKLLGAMAEAGYIYTDIERFHKEITENMTTIPLDYSRDKSKEKITILTDLEDYFAQPRPAKPQTISIALFININKDMGHFEEFSFTQNVIERLQTYPIAISRVLLGNFIGESDTATLTILRITADKTVEFLDASSSAPGLHLIRTFLPSKHIVVVIDSVLTKTGKQYPKRKGPKFGERQRSTLELCIQFACNALISCEKQLNIIDKERSRGNIGSRMKKTCEVVVEKLREGRFELQFPFLVIKKLSVLLETLLGGVLGTIYGVFFENVASSVGELQETDFMTGEEWYEALIQGKNAIEPYCDEKQAMNTMFRPINACIIEIFEAQQDENVRADWTNLFSRGVAAAELGAVETKAPRGQFADAGAHAVGIWMRALVEAVKFKEKEERKY